MPLTLPYQITAGQKLLSKPVRDNFQAIADKFTGGIVDADCSTTMNLQGTKLLDASTPGAKLVDQAITQAKIANLAVGDAQLIVDAVSATKLAALAVLYGKLKATTTVLTFGATAAAIGVGGAAVYDLSSATPATGVTTTGTIVGPAAAYPFFCYVQRQSGNIVIELQSQLQCTVMYEAVAAKWWLQIANTAGGSVPTASLLKVTVLSFSVA